MIMNYEQLKQFCAALVTTSKTYRRDFEALVSSTTKCLDKIGKVITIDDSVHADKLLELGGDNIEFGTTIEEFFEEMCSPQTYDATGSGALTKEDPNYRKPVYSYDLGRKKFKMTIENYDLQKASRTPEDYARFLAIKSKKFADSEVVYKYQLKRQLLANLIEICLDKMGTTDVFDASQSYDADTYLKAANDDARVGVVVKAYESESAHDFDEAVSNGNIVVLDLIKEIAKPVDTQTGEEFIKAVKEDIEAGSDENDGHSIAGNCLGASGRLHLYFTQKIKPSLSVDVKAGTFNLNQVTFDCPDTVIRDFGNADSSVFAILIDERIAKLHPIYEAMRRQENADGDWQNYFKHMTFNGHISPFGFVRIYKVATNSNKKVDAKKK